MELSLPLVVGVLLPGKVSNSDEKSITLIIISRRAAPGVLTSYANVM